jgi:hypothetical protein
VAGHELLRLPRVPRHEGLPDRWDSIILDIIEPPCR